MVKGQIMLLTMARATVQANLSGSSTKTENLENDQLQQASICYQFQ